MIPNTSFKKSWIAAKIDLIVFVDDSAEEICQNVPPFATNSLTLLPNSSDAEYKLYAITRDSRLVIQMDE